MPAVFFSHTWSLAVEEHFYLLWPFVLPLILRTRRPVAWIAGLAVASALLRVDLVESGVQVWRSVGYCGPFTNAFAVMAGSALAIRPWRVSRTWGTTGLIGLVALSALPYVVFSTTFYLLAIPAAVVSVIVLSNPPAVLASPVLGYIGRVSYTWYLWHLFAMVLVDGNDRTPAVSLPVAVVTFGIAALSWRYVEQPILAAVRSRTSNATAGGRVTDGLSRTVVRGCDA